MKASAAVPAVSIILPVRNAQKTLAQSMESCLQQTFRRIELLVVLNGCTDQSETIARAFAEQDPRVRILESAEDEGVVGGAWSWDGSGRGGPAGPHGCG